MGEVHILLTKTYHKGTAVPFFEIIDQIPNLATLPPRAKVVTLQLGEYVDVARCRVSNDELEFHVDSYRVSNIDGQAKMDFLESYFFERLQ